MASVREYEDAITETATQMGARVWFHRGNSHRVAVFEYHGRTRKNVFP